MPNGKPSIAFIGFGEAGQAIAAGLREAGVETMAAWDILFPQAAGEKLKQAAAAAGVRCANSAADAVRGADVIISAVTAASSVDAAQSVKAHLAGTPYLSRHQLGLARPQAGHRKAPRRRRPLCRRRGAGADLSGAASDADAARRSARRRDRARARRARHARQHCRSRNRRRRRHQDGAQRHDQGHRGADAWSAFSPRRAPASSTKSRPR